MGQYVPPPHIKKTKERSRIKKWLQVAAFTTLSSISTNLLNSPVFATALGSFEYTPTVQRAKLYPQMDNNPYLFMGVYTPKVANAKLDAFAMQGIDVATEMSEQGKLVLLRPKNGNLDNLVHTLEPTQPKTIQKESGTFVVKPYEEPTINCYSLEQCITNVDRLRHLPYFEDVREVAKELAADPKLRQYQFFNERIAQNVILTMIAIESDGDPQVVSHMGAVGLTQIMPQTAKIYMFGNRKVSLHYIHQRLKDPDFHFAALEEVSKPYMKAAAAHSGSSQDFIEKALAAHNAGPGSLPGERYKTFRETRGYVARGAKIMQILMHKPI
jgi:hypothetical protein